jgi:predicted deacylase
MRGEIKPIGFHASGTQKMAAIVAAECYTSAPFAGHYEEVLPCGITVKKGDTIGRLHDFDRIDEPACPILAGVDGTIVGQAWGARVLRGQHVACVGVPYA